MQHAAELLRLHSWAKEESQVTAARGAEWVGCTHSSLSLVLFELLPHSEELLMLARYEVNSCILQ